MTPEQKIKAHLLNNLTDYGGRKIPAPETTAETVDAIFATVMASNDCEFLQEHREEFRTSGIETGIPAREHSRNYQSDEVAAQMDDGTWVGWTYWHGGGKHGQPEAIDWMDSAYELTVTEEEKLVVIRTFKKA